MATRKALVLVSGLFQELNSSSDKLDFAGNSTSDLSEGTNQYFTTARARGSVSVTDSGGLGSLGYDNSSGVITYAGPSNSDVRGLISVASGSGLTYNSSTGEFGTNAIPNAQLANDRITFGSAAVQLGDTVTGISLTNIQAITKLQVGSEGGAGNIVLHADNSGGFSRGITFEGASGGVNTHETLLAVTDPTADRTITLPDATGTVVLLGSLSVASGSGLTYNSGTGEFSTNAIPNTQLANSSVTVGSTGIALGGSATTITGLSSITSSAVVTDDNGFRIRDNSDNTKQLAFECSGISGSTTRTLTVPDANGTIATQAYVNSQISAEDLDVETDSGNFDVDLNSEALTIAGGTGIDSSGSGTTATIAIDSTVTTLTGSQTLTNKTIVLGNNTVSGALANGITATTQSASDNSTKVATTAYVDNQVTAGATNEFADNVFRVKDNSDASKKLAFECSGISGSTTRTMTVPNTDGTISTESFATAIAVALG